MAADILIVDDEADIRDLIAGILEDEGHRTRLARDSDEALRAIEERRPQLVILDIWLQGSRLDGLEVLSVIKRTYPDLPVVIISGHGNIETAVTAIKRGAYDYIEKPFKADRLMLVAERALEASQLKREVKELRERSTVSAEMIGKSTAINQLRSSIERVAPTNSRVLIRGSSGSGKELVARTIHKTSYRRDKPFVVVDCGSLPETLLESELFGHVKGAFTGATNSKRGLFEEAHGGTVFLDEIADTSPTFQAKLLRVLQEGEIKRVGGTQPVKIDVRVISASNKDLAELVKLNAFRQDLYYRLAVLPLHLPSLQERRSDIPLLVHQFVIDSCTRHRQPLRHVSDEVMSALTTAAWPGNVRELQHYIERAVVTTIGSELTCTDLLAKTPPAESIDLRTVSRGAVRQAERARILQALQQAAGNRMKAARLLKISRASLYNKLREYDIR